MFFLNLWLPTGSNACSKDNGRCSHLCIPTPTGRVCKCADGIELDSETNTTCLTSSKLNLYIKTTQGRPDKWAVFYNEVPLIQD